MIDLFPYQSALAGITRSPVEKRDNGSLRATFTRHRYLESTAEPDGMLSAWAVGVILIAGRETVIAVYVGHLHEPQRTSNVLGRAKVWLQEAINGGSRSATKLGEGADASGRRVYVYAAPGVDLGNAMARLETFTARNRVTLIGAEKATAKETKSTAQQKARKVA